MSERSGMNHTESARRWLTVEQAANYLSVVPYTIRSAVWGGELAAAKLGNRLVFDRSDLDKWAESKKRLEPAFQ
jgi:excisionase family DNA binding protein